MMEMCSNSKFKERDFGGYIGMNKRWGFSHFNLSRFDQRLGLVEGDRDPATGKFIKYNGTPSRSDCYNEMISINQILFEPDFKVCSTISLILDNNFEIRKSRLKIISPISIINGRNLVIPKIPARKACSLISELLITIFNGNYRR